MADIKQTQEAEHAKLVLDRISNLPVERDLLMAGAVYSREKYGGDCRHFTTLIDTDDLKALSARLTAMEEALEKARKDVKFAMGTTGYPTVVRNYLDTILFDINQVLEKK